MKSQISPLRSAPSLRSFSQLLSATPRGARLVRLLAVQQLADWGWPPSSPVSETVALVVGELAANAVTHGRVPGRDFRLTLTVGDGSTLRVEVADARGERLPSVGAPAAEDDAGRGLLLVDALVDRWGVEPRPPSGKTVWACLKLA
ncbi:ATP-binding protein [Streptomyces flaveolus]|uniref:ATP-binding protein n=1 Tax=Streptomyces flaveolus TaxID=67297 RepID=UPI0033B4B168